MHACLRVWMQMHDMHARVRVSARTRVWRYRAAHGFISPLTLEVAKIQETTGIRRTIDMHMCRVYEM